METLQSQILSLVNFSSLVQKLSTEQTEEGLLLAKGEFSTLILQILSNEKFRNALVSGFTVDIECPATTLREHNSVQSLLLANDKESLLQLLTVGVAGLLLFLQYNSIGPIKDAPTLGQLLKLELNEAAPPNSSGTRSEWQLWVLKQLQLDGEEVLGGCTLLDYLWLAEAILLAPLGVLTRETATHSTNASSGNSETHGSCQEGDTVLGCICLAAPSWLWWAFRVLCTHQRLLPGRSATLLHAASKICPILESWSEAATQEVFTTATGEGPSARALGGLEGTTKGSPQPGTVSVADCKRCPQGVELLHDANLRACLEIELSLFYFGCGHIKHGRARMQCASRALGLDLQLTGALGKRTIYQIDPKAQLVARLNKSRPLLQQSTDGEMAQQQQQQQQEGTEQQQQQQRQQQQEEGTEQQQLEQQQEGTEQQQQQQQQQACSSRDDGLLPVAHLSLDGATLSKDLEGMEDESGVLQAPQLAESGLNEPGEYGAAEQCLLLCAAAAVRYGSAQDEVAQWQAAPWVEAVLRQQRSVFCVQVLCRLLKSRHERTRVRVKERALLDLERLCDTIQAQHVPADEAPQTAATRARYSFTCPLPLLPTLRLELAQQYVALGIVGAALKLFEELESWDSLIACQRLLGKAAAAQDTITKRLQVTPDDPKLWCALGDIQLCDAHYEHAWEVSGKRHARAKRSLGRAALRRGQYTEAAEHLAAALALSPLYEDSWFSLGYAYMKLGETGKALKAFTKVTQLDPEHSEAWNNLGALWLSSKSPRRAYMALEQAMRLNRSDWRATENFATAAGACGEWASAVRALRQVMELSEGKRFKTEILDEILAALEGRKFGVLQQNEDEGEEGEPGTSDEEVTLLNMPLPLFSTFSMPTATPTPDEDAENPDRNESGTTECQASSHITSSSGPAPDHSPESTPSTRLLQDQNLESRSDQHASVDEPCSSSGTCTDSGQLSGRQRELLLRSVHTLLKTAVTGPTSSPAVWSFMARYFALVDDREGQKEAILKQVRALQGTAFATDPKYFVEMATASAGMCRMYLDILSKPTSSESTSSTPVTARDLAAARMHARSVLTNRNCVERFSETTEYKELQELMKEVGHAEDRLRATTQKTS